MKKHIIFYCHSKSRIDAVEQFINILSVEYNFTILIHDSDSKNFESEIYNIIVIKPKISFISNLLKNSFVKKIKNSTLGMILHEILFGFKFKQEYSYIYEIFVKHNFDLFITLSDRHTSTFEYAIMKCAKEMKKKILIPYLYHTNPEGYLQGILNNKNFILSSDSTYYEKIIFKKFANFSYKSHHVYRAFLYQVFYKNKVLSENPWVLGAGLADMVAVSNIKQQEDYIKLNPKGLYPIVGDISYQIILDSIQNNKKDFFDKYCLDTNKKIIIVSLGQFYELNYCSLEQNQKIISYIINNIEIYENNYNLLISFHPSMKKENYDFLLNNKNLIIVEEQLNTYIHLADIFIANSSATVLWSTLLGIKTIILSYNYGLDFFSYLTSPIFVTNSEELENKLDYTINEYVPDFEQDWRNLSKEQVFNSNIINRYISCIDSLIQSSRKE